MSVAIRITSGLLFLALAACGGTGGYGGVTNPPPPPPPPPPNGTVDATPSEAFTPRQTTIHAGESVTYKFGSLGHNVKFDTQNAGTPADIGGINANVSIQRTFTTAGTYDYHCTIHPNMTGSVVVQ